MLRNYSTALQDSYSHEAEVFSLLIKCKELKNMGTMHAEMEGVTECDIKQGSGVYD